jgi:hypothetical protein
MPLFESQQQNGRGNRWLGMVTTVVVDFFVLLALAFTVVRYVEWSSAAAQAEFMSAARSSASDRNHSGEFSTSISLKGQAGCPPKG